MYGAEGKKAFHSVIQMHPTCKRFITEFDIGIIMYGLLPTQDLKPLRKQASESEILGILFRGLCQIYGWKLEILYFIFPEDLQAMRNHCGERGH